MSEYICKCGKTLELQKETLEVKDGKIRTKEAVCLCGKDMQAVEKEFNGFPHIKRNEEHMKKK
tara:strand:+ start:203 stop:391 length:189 start_codon:yes stop_codon:yes gene_type:complete